MRQKNLQKCHKVSFMLAISSWVRTLVLIGDCISSQTTLERTNFSFLNDYQLVIASEIGICTCTHFPLDASSLSGLDSACPVFALTVSVNPYIHWSCCLQKTLFWYLPSSLTYRIFSLPIYRVPCVLKGQDNGDISFRNECSQVSYFLHIVWLWVFVFFSHLIQEETSLMMAEHVSG